MSQISNIQCHVAQSKIIQLLPRIYKKKNLPYPETLIKYHESNQQPENERTFFLQVRLLKTSIWPRTATVPLVVFRRRQAYTGSTEIWLWCSTPQALCTLWWSRDETQQQGVAQYCSISVATGRERESLQCVMVRSCRTEEEECWNQNTRSLWLSPGGNQGILVPRTLNSFFFFVSCCLKMLHWSATKRISDLNSSSTSSELENIAFASKQHKHP